MHQIYGISSGNNYARAWVSTNPRGRKGIVSESQLSTRKGGRDGGTRGIIPETKSKHTAQQFRHEEAREYKADVVQDMVGEFPVVVRKVLVAFMLAHVKRDEEIREDTRDVERDESDDKIVSPFGREEALKVVAQAPDGGVFAVDLDDVAGYKVL